jgi:hypothetical protein
VSSILDVAELNKLLVRLSKKETWADDIENFNPYESSGGNFDDAYWAGETDGEVLLARMILDEHFNEEDDT